jgi:hypothetical protein
MVSNHQAGRIQPRAALTLLGLLLAIHARAGSGRAARSKYTMKAPRKSQTCPVVSGSTEFAFVK